MNLILIRTLLPAVLLLLMTRAGSAFDPQGWIVCDMRACNIQVVVNEVKMKDATLEEAVACIQTAAAKSTPNNYFNVVFQGKVSDPTKRLTLDLKQIPLKLALEEVARTFDMRLRPEPNAVLFVSPSYPEPIHTRTYQVPPDFISTGSAK